MNKYFKGVLVVGLAVICVAVFYFLYKAGKPKQAPVVLENNEVKSAGISDEELKEKIGQMIMIGFRGTEAQEGSDIYNVIKDVKIGGVVMFDYDTPSKTYNRNIASLAQTQKLIADIQKYSKTPLFVAVDAEGGNVNRLKPKYGFSAVVSEEAMGKDKTLNTTRKESEKKATELKTAGFNMNLAPVVDVNVNPKNPIIGALGRSFSANPDEVFNNAKVFIQSHTAKNIITVAKHFPGHGSTVTDSHLGIADVTKTYKQEELIPYKKLNDEGLLDVVMVAHVMNKDVDKNYPATMSPAFIQDILRKQIGFKGVVISDDMQMGAITKNYGFEDSIIMAINAGCDIVEFSNNTSEKYDSQMPYKVRDIIFDAVKSGKIDQKRILESYNRIVNLKAK